MIPSLLLCTLHLKNKNWCLLGIILFWWGFKVIYLQNPSSIWMSWTFLIILQFYVERDVSSSSYSDSLLFIKSSLKFESAFSKFLFIVKGFLFVCCKPFSLKPHYISCGETGPYLTINNQGPCMILTQTQTDQPEMSLTNIHCFFKAIFVNKSTADWYLKSGDSCSQTWCDRYPISYLSGPRIVLFRSKANVLR